MIKKIAVLLMMGQLLFGSIVLPLGDFSLLQELPRMYHEYEKVVSPEDKGICDFIGDYLLDGKDLLGHNKHDQPLKAGNIQFQHTAIFAMLVHPGAPSVLPLFMGAASIHKVVYLSSPLSDYHPSLFRPPLA